MTTVLAIRRRATVLAAAHLALVAGLAGCARGKSASRGEAPATQVGAAEPSGDWLNYNGPLSGDRYSPLAQITTENVAQLRQVCAFDAPEAVSFQTGIVAVGGVLYFTVFGDTYAIDGTTCQTRWKHSRPEPANFLLVNRGVGYAEGKLFRGTGDGHALALDAATGQPLWDVAIADPKKGESVPMAPVAWNGLVFIGNAGGDNFDVQGRIYALDAGSGRTVWRFETIPESGPARATWKAASPENPPGGGATWTSYAVDETNGVLYVSTGNASPDFVEQLHPGENLYSTAVVALDAKTGRLLEYVQPIHGDFHDWDVSAGPALITTRGGRPFIAAAAKDGYVYGIDRSGVSGGSTPGSGGLAVRYKAQATTRENTDTPLTTTGLTRFCPGSQGGMEWNGPTYHRELGTLYVNAIDWCTSVKLQPVEKMKGAPGMPWTGMDDPKNAFGLLDPIDRWKGWVTAVDAESGQLRWQVQTPKPMVAGITATAGGLVFTGDLDGNALAYDAATGWLLWKDAIGKPIGGGVISYETAGKQHVAVAAGLNSPIWPVKGGPARVVVYALP